MVKSFLLLLTIFLCGGAMAQTSAADTLAPYQKNNKLPAFNLLQADGNWYNTNTQNKDRNVVLILFNPDCHHCEIEAEEIKKHIDKLANVNILWITTSEEKQEVEKFAQKYNFDTQPNIQFLYDPNYAIPVFYEVRSTPFIAIYNKKGLLEKVYRNGVTVAGILDALK